MTVLLPHTIAEKATEGKQPVLPQEKVEGTKNPNAVALGRLGGLKGGKAWAE